MKEIRNDIHEYMGIRENMRLELCSRNYWILGNSLFGENIHYDLYWKLTQMYAVNYRVEI